MPSSSIAIQQQVSLAPYTTFRIGGPARFFCEVSSEAELLEAVRFARQQNLDIFVLGGGSNLLVSDAGFDGLVIRIALRQPPRISASDESVDYIAAAGTDWDEFVLSVCERGLSGVECLAGIPGCVGGTPVQNVGAYGQEVADTITEVRALDLDTVLLAQAQNFPEAKTFVTLAKNECGFSYRRSIFNSTQRNRYIVTQVTYRFSRASTPNLAYADLARHFAQPGQPTHPTPIDVYHVVREIRHRKGMLIVEGEPDSRSAGSFFKNPIVPEAALAPIAATLHIAPDKIPHWPAHSGHIKLPAAWLLEQAGFPKGFEYGGAGISSRHTLALINRGDAQAADILRLRNLIQHEVESRFHIALEQEPVLVGP